MPYKTPTPQELHDSFQRQLREAHGAGADHFIDQDTKTLINFDRVTGLPSPMAIWVRSLRIQHRAREGRWWRRLRRAIARVLGWNQVPAPKGTQRDMAEIWDGPAPGAQAQAARPDEGYREGELGCDSPHKNFTITGDGKHD